MIYLATPQDAKIVWGIEKKCFKKDNRYTLSAIRDLIKEGAIWILEVAHFPIGFAVIEYRTDFIYIASLDILPKFRGCGYGSNLMEWAEFAAGFKHRKIKLHVSVDNAAQKLYYDLGYRVQGVVKSYYGKGKNALLMEKKL